MKQLDNRSIETNGEIIKFDIAIRQIVEYKDFFVILLREKREVPNNIRNMENKRYSSGKNPKGI